MAAIWTGKGYPLAELAAIGPAERWGDKQAGRYEGPMRPCLGIQPLKTNYQLNLILRKRSVRPLFWCHIPNFFTLPFSLQEMKGTCFIATSEWHWTHPPFCWVNIIYLIQHVILLLFSETSPLISCHLIFLRREQVLKIYNSIQWIHRLDFVSMFGQDVILP